MTIMPKPCPYCGKIGFHICKKKQQNEEQVSKTFINNKPIDERYCENK